MYRLTLAVLLISSFGIPAPAEKLYGTVVVQDTAFQAEEPVADDTDDSDWAAWRLRVAKEIRGRTLRIIQEYRYATAGKLRVRYRVARSGEIEIVVIDDESTNLGLLVPNVIESLHHSPVLLFPTGSRKQTVESDTVYQASADDEVKLVSSTEPRRQDAVGK